MAAQLAQPGRKSHGLSEAIGVFARASSRHYAVESFAGVDRSPGTIGKYLKISPPKRGSKITVAKNGSLQVPDDPIVPYIQGEGITPEVWKSAQAVFDIAVERCYANAK